VEGEGREGKEAGEGKERAGKGDRGEEGKGAGKGGEEIGERVLLPTFLRPYIASTLYNCKQYLILGLECKLTRITLNFYRAMHVVLARYCYRKSSVRLSVRLRDVVVPWAYILSLFESNYTNN